MILTKTQKINQQKEQEMEVELNYLSIKIEEIEGKIYTIETNRKNFITDMGLSFIKRQLTGLNKEKKVLENILNKLTEIELAKF